MKTILRKEDLNGKAAVYVAWGKRNECLYVGMTSQGFLRPLTNRTLRKVWDKIERIAIEWQSNSDVARMREAELIKTLCPLLNRALTKQAPSSTESDYSALVAKALNEANGDKLIAAQALGISRATLYRRLRPRI